MQTNKSSSQTSATDPIVTSSALTTTASSHPPPPLLSTSLQPSYLSSMTKLNPLVLPNSFDRNDMNASQPMTGTLKQYSKSGGDANDSNNKATVVLCPPSRTYCF